jgi:DNA topoisomerase-1
MDVVVVESPAKAKTINKYLGEGYKVLASYGHVRDLVAKDGAVKPDDDFAMTWEVDGRAERPLSAIAQALRGARHLYLATDPDREGEAISWHLEEVLRQRNKLGDVGVKRIVFHEITKSAVSDAIRNPRGLNRELVDAYLARRALDYLVGFTLSPVLWRKLPGSRSAGRVQSVALRLICEREAEIEVFRPQEYWTVSAAFTTPAKGGFIAQLTHLDGSKLGKFDLKDRDAAETAVRTIAAGTYTVADVERRTVRRHPPPPFTTSTLQQDASRKLGFGASRTMRLAQQLYEGVTLNGDTVGLISYMRTDSVQLSQEALTSARSSIAKRFGRRYLPSEPRHYRSQAKNAQEAHEAIRPTDFARHPEDTARSLEPDQARLYELIWKRAMASQMESAQIDQTSVDIADGSGRTVLRASGSIVLFDGFLALYQEGRDDDGDDEDGRRLPDLAKGMALDRGEIKPEQHFTQPPPRYTEASLVKRLEELGIGRPSTYASIIQVLQDRDYVRLEKRRFVPEDRGRVVTAFLANFFERYVEYDFTADLEGELDAISNGKIDWKSVLRAFWKDFSEAVGGTADLRVSQVLDALDADLGPHFFPEPADGSNPRSCPSCKAGRLGLKLGKFGAFVGCSNYPECRFTRKLAINGGDKDGAQLADNGPRALGDDPSTSLPVSLRKGPYGYYVQLGPAAEDGKPKRVSLPRGLGPADVDLKRAIALLSLPRELGRHPDTGETIVAGIGRFGPYLKHGAAFKSLGKDEDVLTIGINRAVEILATARATQPGRDLGQHPRDRKPIVLKSGRYGPYVQHGRLRATLRKGQNAETLGVDEAVALLDAKAAKEGAPKAAKPTKAVKAKRSRSTRTAASSAVDGDT